MLSLRFVACTIRGMSAITSSQLGTCTHGGLQQNQCTPVNNSILRCPPSMIIERKLNTTTTHLQASRLQASAKTKAPTADVEINIPERPKKPVTPWIMFVRERKDQIMAEHGSKMSASAIAVILAKEWQNVDKSRYEHEYQRLHEDYSRELANYERSLTDEQRDYIEFKRDAKRESKAIKQLRKTHPPVLPRNPANLYCHVRSKQDDVKQLLKVKKPTEVFSDIFKEYRSLSESEKQKYLDMQEEDKSRFQHEFLAWYEGIQNNEDLSKAARERAFALRERLKCLNYI